MLSSIFSAVGIQIVDAFLGKALKAFELYNQKQISMEELRTRLQQSMLEAFKAVEVAHSDALTKTYESFQQTLRTSPKIQFMYMTVVYSQLFVLVWSQWFVPLMFWLGYQGQWRAGTSAEWAYLLLAALCGMAPVVLRSGPGAGSILERVKSLSRG